MILPCADKNALPKWKSVKISPTYLSTNLMAPLRIPPADTVARSYIISDGLASCHNCPQPTWSTFVNHYGGIGGLPFLDKTRRKKEDLLVSRSHRHYLSSAAKMIHGTVQPKYITPFIKSKLRQHDETIPTMPTSKEHEMMREKNELIKELPEFCFISKNDLFPKSQTEYEGRRKQVNSHKHLGQRTLEELKKLAEQRFTSLYHENFPLPPQPMKSKPACRVQSSSRRKRHSPLTSSKSNTNTAINRGLWPCWPAGNNYIISNVTGQIVEKRDVVSLDDTRDCRCIKNSTVNEKNADNLPKRNGVMSDNSSKKLQRPRTPRRKHVRPKSPCMKHRNYTNRLNQIVEDTARPKQIALDSKKAEWGWYTGQHLDFLQGVEPVVGATSVAIETDDVQSVSSHTYDNQLRSEENDGSDQENDIDTEERMDSCEGHCKRNAKIRFDMQSTVSSTSIPTSPKQNIHDPFSISLDLERAVGTCADLLKSVSVRRAMPPKTNCKSCCEKLIQNARISKRQNDSTLAERYGLHLGKGGAKSNSAENYNERMKERLGPRFKTIIMKQHHQQHDASVPDLRDFRPTFRKSHWLGYHTSVFR